MRILFTAAAALLLAAPAMADMQTPISGAKKERVDAIIQSPSTQQTLSQFFSLMGAQMQQAILAGLKKNNPALTAEQQGAAAGVVQSALTDFRTKLMNIVADIYVKNFTDAEINALYAFNMSPEGQSIAKKLPGLMQSAMQESMSTLTPALVKDIQTKLASDERLKGLKLNP